MMQRESWIREKPIQTTHEIGAGTQVMKAKPAQNGEKTVDPVFSALSRAAKKAVELRSLRRGVKLKALMRKAEVDTARAAFYASLCRFES